MKGAFLMKRLYQQISAVLIVCLALSGCAGFPGSKRQNTESLNQWLGNRGYETVVEELRTNSFLKERRFLIVRARGDSIDTRIDRLTEEIADGLRNRILENSEIKVVSRRPATEIEREYRLNEINFDKFRGFDSLLTIQIRPYGNPSEGLTRVRINAYDLEKHKWIGGFSVYNDFVKLTDQQLADLNAPYIDPNLKGMRYLPYQESEYDLMARYLALTLTSKFQELYGGEPVFLYTEYPENGRPKAAEITKFLERYLNDFNEIRMTLDPDRADWKLVVDAMETGSDSGLYQLWVEIVGMDKRNKIRGITADAYFLAEKTTKENILGTWDILAPSGNKRCGRLEILDSSGGGLRGRFFGPDGVSLIRKEVTVKALGDAFEFTVYEKSASRLIRFDCVPIGDGSRIAADITSFPPSDIPKSMSMIKIY